MSAPQFSQVGFRLIGKIGNTYDYDFLFHPGVVGTEKATITHSIRGSEEWPIKYSGPKVFEAACQALLAQDARVKVSKGGWKGIRKTVKVLAGQPSSLPPAVFLQVKGEDNGKEYQIDFHSTDQGQCRGQVKSQENQYEQKPLCLDGVSYALIQANFSNLQNHIQVQIDPQDASIHISSKVSAVAQSMIQPPPVNQSLTALPSLMPILAVASLPPDEPAAPSLLEMHDVQQLVQQVAIGRLLASKIAHGMVNRFAKKVPPAGVIQEIAVLIDKMETDEGFRIFATLFPLVQDCLGNPEIIKALAAIFSRFQRLYYCQVFKEARNSTPAHNPLEQLDRDILVKMMEGLTTLMNNLHHQPGDMDLLKNLLTASIGLLDVMAIRKVFDIAEKIHQETYTAIAQFSEHRYPLQIRYLANYGQQILSVVKDNISNTQSCLHRASLVLQAGGKILDSLDLAAPWKVITGVIEAAPILKKAFTFDQQKKEWFLHLFGIRCLLFRNSPDAFICLTDNILRNYSEVKQEIDFTNPHLTVGFVDLAMEILRFPNFGQQDKVVRLNTIEILGTIYHNNGPDEVEDDQPFRVGPKDRIELRNLVTTHLYSLKSHPLLSVRTKVDQIIEKEHIDLPGDVIPFNISYLTPDHQTSELFNKAVREHAPLLLTMQRIKNALERNEQLKRNEPYFIPLDVKEKGSNSAHPLADKIQGFLGNKGARVMTIHGPGGAGKSFGIKVFVHQLLRQYNENGYFPIYVFLPDVPDPVRGAVSYILEKYGIDLNQQDELREMKIVWILDAYDEIRSFARSGDEKENLFIKNQFTDEWPNAKVIFLYKTKTADSARFRSEHAEPQEFLLSPFDELKIFSYVRRYFEVRDKGHKDNPQEIPPLEWTLEQYIEAFNAIKNSDVLWEVIKNPFRLTVMVEVFPCIAKKFCQENGLSLESMIDLQDLFEGKKEGEIINRLFEAYASVLAQRARLKTGFAFKLEDFVDYQINIALAMHKKGPDNNIPWPSQDPSIVKAFGNFLNPSMKDYYSNCLVPTDTGWAFMHKDFWIYLTTASDPRIRQKILEAMPSYTI